MKFEITTWTTMRAALHDSNEPENARLLAHMYWRTLIVCALLAALGCVWYGYSEFASVSSTLDVSSQEHAAQVSASQAKIEATAAGLSARADSYNTLKAQPIATPDPSQ